MGGMPVSAQHHHAHSNDDISAAIRKGLDLRIAEITSEIIHKAEQELRERIHQVMISYALEFSTHLDVVHARNELIIRLKNNEGSRV